MRFPIALRGLCALLCLAPALVRAQNHSWEVGASMSYSCTNGEVKGISYSEKSFSLRPYARRDVTRNIYAGLGLEYAHVLEHDAHSHSFALCPFVGYTLPIYGRFTWVPELAVAPGFLSGPDESYFQVRIGITLGHVAYQLSNHVRFHLSFGEMAFSHTGQPGGSQNRFALRINPLENMSMAVGYVF